MKKRRNHKAKQKYMSVFILSAKHCKKIKIDNFQLKREVYFIKVILIFELTRGLHFCQRVLAVQLLTKKVIMA